MNNIPTDPVQRFFHLVDTLQRSKFQKQALDEIISSGVNLDQLVGENDHSPPSTTLLINMIRKSCSEHVETLLQAGASPNTCDEKGTSPLERVVYKGDSWKIVKLLFKHNVRISKDIMYKLYGHETNMGRTQPMIKMIEDYRQKKYSLKLYIALRDELYSPDGVGGQVTVMKQDLAVVKQQLLSTNDE